MASLGTPDTDVSILVNDGNQQPTGNHCGRAAVSDRNRGRRARVRVWGAGALLTLLAVAVTGGSSGTTPSSTATTSFASASAPTSSASSSTTKTSISTSYPAGKEQICQARDQLKASITALTDQGLLSAGTTAIKASVDQVQADLDAVKTAAKQDYHAQVTDLQDALQQLQTAVGNLGSGDAAANLRTVGNAITATGAAAEDLFTQLKTACGS